MKNQNKKKSEIEVSKHVNIIYDIVFACLLIFTIGSIIGSYFFNYSFLMITCVIFYFVFLFGLFMTNNDNTKLAMIILTSFLMGVTISPIIVIANNVDETILITAFVNSILIFGIFTYLSKFITAGTILNDTI